MLGDIGDLKYKTFSDDMHEWIDFVCRCRDGAQDYRKYDLISGKVADDKVFITQRAIERLLNYDSYIEV